jgi:hypothetical protein
MDRATAILIFMIPMDLATELARMKIADLHREAARPRKRPRVPSLTGLIRLRSGLKVDRTRRPTPVAEPKCAM